MGRSIQKEQLSFLVQLEISSGFQVTNSENYSNLNLSLNFKGVQTFLDKSDKFSKILCSHDIPKYKFILTHLYSNIRSSFTSEKNDCSNRFQNSLPL
jgi:hypothetical protein